MAALGSIGSALVLVGLKVFLAVATGSLGVLSEALHSGLDLIAAILTWISVRVSDRPADSDHTYGHGKIERFSALVETGLLLVTSVYIIFAAFVRLLYKQVHLEPSLLVILILGLAMGIDLIRSRALARVAREYPSEALEADALHFSTDVWSTFVVILGMAAVWIGQRTGVTWLQDADPIAALVVAAIVMVHMEPRAAVGEHLFDRIRVIAARRGLSIHELSAHHLDGRLFIELHLEVPEQLSLRDAHRRASELEEEIRTLGDVSAPASGAAPIVNIHIEPLGTHIASVDGHEVHVRQVEHKILASCHCAMDGSLPITQIHDVTAALEDRVKEKFPQIARVTIHPEPVEEGEGTKICLV